jgi:Trypsin
MRARVLHPATRAILVIALLAPFVMSCARPAATAQQASPTPPAPASAVPVKPDPRVGAIFLGAGTLHSCSGAVLDSPRGDLILTAAHCLAEGVDTTFVAGCNNAAEAEQLWKVDAVYLDRRWVRDEDPLADFAIARVSRDGGGSVEEQAGGGLALGHAPKPGTVVTVTGYGLGEGGGPVGCRATTTTSTAGFPSLSCAGFVDGTSGAPWIAGPVVIGLIGGLDGGGCDDSVSYSPPFDGQIARLLRRAEAGGPGDAAPNAFEDDC